MTQGLKHGVMWKWSQSKEHLNVALQEMFPNSADDKVDDVMSLTEKYHRYKREYVKHLSFNPEEDNLSKSVLTSQ